MMARHDPIEVACLLCSADPDDFSMGLPLNVRSEANPHLCQALTALPGSGFKGSMLWV